MERIVVFLLTFFHIFLLVSAIELDDVKNKHISEWWAEADYGKIPENVTVSFDDTLTFSTTIGEGNFGIVCNGDFALETHQLNSKKICAKISTKSYLKNSIKRIVAETVSAVGFQQQVRKEAMRTEFKECIGVPKASNNVVFWNAGDYISTAYFMEQITTIQTEIDFEKVTEFLTKGHCLATMFDFLDHLQRQNLYPGDIKYENMGFVTKDGDLSKLMLFDLGDNHQFSSSTTHKPQMFRIKEKEYSEFQIVGRGENGFNPAFFDLYVFYLLLCFPENKDFSDEYLSSRNKRFFSEAKLFYEKQQECIEKNPAWKDAFTKLSTKFEKMENPIEKNTEKEFDTRLKFYFRSFRK